MQMKAQAEQLARQQAEVQAQQQQQQEELARRQAAMEEQQRQLEQQRQQAEEQERQLAMLPPANAPGAGNALLSLLQSSDAGLPQQQQLDTSSLDALWAQDMPGGNNGEVGFGRGRGRGRGVCSAALGTGAQRPKFGRGGSGDGLGLEGLQLDQPGGLPGMGEPPSGGGAHLVEPEADDKGRKKKNKKDKGGKGGGEAPREDICDDHDEQPGSQLPAWGGGWGDAPSNAPAAVYAADRPASASMAEIQAEEEKARAADQKQRAAAASAQAEADWQRPMGSVWGGNHAQRQSQPPPARVAAAAPQPPQQTSQPKSFAQLARAGAQQPPPPQRSAEAQAALKAAGLDEDAMLWDYGGREAEILGPAAAAAAAAAAAPAKQPKKKKGGAAAEQPESPARTNGRAASQPAEAPQDDSAADSAFGVGEGSMPPAMSRWCQEQMLALTGNDDTTLTHFLFSLEVRAAPRHTGTPAAHRCTSRASAQPLAPQAYARACPSLTAAPLRTPTPCPPLAALTLTLTLTLTPTLTLTLTLT